jgi:pilus assembly protein CpaE
MLTTGIASGDASSYGQLLATLQQTGLVGSVKQWEIPADKLPDGSEGIPDVVLLDLGRDPQPYFTFGAHLRRLRPGVCLIACSSTYPPNQQLMLDAMRSGVQDFISKPATPDAIRVILERLDQEGSSPEQITSRKLIVLMGAKGGVGTTTIAVNLGAHLSMNAHKHTALLDFARPLGNAHLFLDVRPRFGIRDAMDNLDRLDTHFFGGLLTQHKSKLELLGGAQQPEEWRSISMAPLERVVNVAQANFDVVLMDIGSQFSMDLAPVLLMARMVLLVTEANVPSLWSLERRLLALNGLGLEPDRLRLIVNRWHKGDDEVLKSVEKNIKNPIIASLPNDFKQASAAQNLGMPIMKNHNDVLSARYRQLASQLAGGEAMPQPPGKRSGLSSVFSPGKR